MTLPEFVEGFKDGKYGLVYENSKGFYDFCDRLEPLLCLNHEIAWYANRGINSIRKFANYCCGREPDIKRFGVLFINTQIEDLDFWWTKDKNAVIQNGKARINRELMFSLVHWRDINNDCADFEELL